MPQTTWFKTKEIYFHAILESGSEKLKCGQNCTSSKVHRARSSTSLSLDLAELPTPLAVPSSSDIPMLDSVFI